LVYGQVTDAFGNPVDGAEIWLRNRVTYSDNSTITNETGYYAINARSGLYSIEVNMMVDPMTVIMKLYHYLKMKPYVVISQCFQDGVNAVGLTTGWIAGNMQLAHQYASIYLH